MNYYIKIISNKPKEDINQIVESMGFSNIAPDCNRSGGVAHFIVKLTTLARILWKLRRGDMLFIQYPYKKFFTATCLCAHLKRAKVVTLIHDLGSFRRKKLTAAHENRRLSHTDRLIVHNESMQRFLEEHGCRVPMVCLGIFDYLSPSAHAQYASPHKPWQVIYAGGLGSKRNPFLYELDPHLDNWEMQLYGKAFEPEKAAAWQHIGFKGLLPPDRLIAEAEADFGLVWDGDSLDRCSGDWGEYLKINNPHKTSFYLRAGIPVIIWKEAALAPFVQQHGVGLCVDSLDDINVQLGRLSPDDYRLMRSRAEAISQQLDNGFFTRQALSEVIASL